MRAGRIRGIVTPYFAKYKIKEVVALIEITTRRPIINFLRELWNSFRRTQSAIKKSPTYSPLFISFHSSSKFSEEPHKAGRERIVIVTTFRISNLLRVGMSLMLSRPYITVKGITAE